MAVLKLRNGTERQVTALEGLRCLKALKWPEKCSEGLVKYVSNVQAVAFDTGLPPEQAEMWWNK